MKKAILVVSFGTTHLDTLEKTIAAVERDIQAANPETPCFRAFTSGIVRKRLEAKGIHVDSTAQALWKLEQKEFTHVTIQPTLLLPGEEYEKLCEEAKEHAGTMHLKIGRPLLWDDADMCNLVNALKKGYPMPDDTVLLAMGHGTSHTADNRYTMLRRMMQAQGMELCTVEGSIGFEHAVEALKKQPKRKVHLVPLLLVAGDHSKNDMAGDEPDSLKSLLTDAGFEVTYSLRGLGELDAMREAFVNRLR